MALNKAAEVKGNEEVKQIFLPLVKVDEVKKEVWGVVTAEVPDREAEICDYETTVPFYKELNDEMSKATDGKNIFPLRAMHGLIAAGKGISIEFRKEAKEIFMGFKVVDDVEWKKCAEGVYTGFSQGGRYIKKWKEGEYTKYTAKPSEISLVDLPCLPRAHFDYVKSDGTVELRKFSATPELPTGNQGEISTRPTSVEPGIDKGPIVCECDCANCQAGDCAHCAGGKCTMNGAGKIFKYLVTLKDGATYLPYTKKDDKLDFRAMHKAWVTLSTTPCYIDVEKKVELKSSDQQKAIKRLKQLYAKEGRDTPSERGAVIESILKSHLEDVIQNRAYGQLNKGLYTIGRFAQIIEDVKYLWLSMEYEREYEGDDSPATDNVHEAYISLLDHLLEYTEESVAEEKAHEFVV